VPSRLAAVAILEPEQGGEFRVVDFDGRLGAVHDRADQDALLALVERCGAGGGGVGLRSRGFWLVGQGRNGVCAGADVWMCGCWCAGVRGYLDLIGSVSVMISVCGWVRVRCGVVWKKGRERAFAASAAGSRWKSSVALWKLRTSQPTCDKFAMR
jgi:hypothetical protein